MKPLQILQPPPNTARRFTLTKPWVVRVGRMYFRRVGRCRPERCGAACCKVAAFGDYHTAVYWAALQGIRRIRRRGRIWFYEKACALLDGVLCGVHRTKPVTCYQFPAIPTDGVYQLVKKVCSYRFVRITRKQYERVAKQQRKWLSRMGR